MTLPGLIIAAPRSGAGKTTVALGLMRAFARRGLRVAAFKNGPDYIDPAFHAVATGQAGCNLDSWAMTGALIDHLVHLGQGDLALVEGSMGLFDGGALPGAAGHGATADLAARLGWPVVLVLDVSGQAQSAAAVALGFARYRTDVPVAGVILNRVASDRHARLVTEACEALNLPVFGALYRDAMPRLEERHLGLVQAGEVPQLEALLDRLAEAMAAALDLDRLQGLARPAHGAASAAPPLTAPAGRIALARDDAFSFLYPHLLAAWRAAGTSILPFSPLADEAPDATADLVWLPGGYPELHAGRLAGNHRFIAGLQGFAGPIHGECGGYMVLGQGMIDAGGTRHAMAGLLGLESDFSRRKLHLGYRLAKSLEPSPLGPPGTRLRGHEFHYASIAGLGGDAPLFETTDAAGKPLPPQGSRRGRVTGSFFHMIAPA